MDKIEKKIEKIMNIKNIEKQKRAFLKLYNKQSDEAVRIDLIKYLSDQEILADIASNHPNNEFRKEAVKFVSDQKTLRQIIDNEQEDLVLYGAVSGLTDQNHLAELALSSENKQIRFSAVCNLTDQEVLASVAAKAEEDDILRIVAIEKLTDQNMLEKIFMDNEDDDIRCAVIKRATNRAFLNKIRNEGGLDVSLAARERYEELPVDDSCPQSLVEAVLDSDISMAQRMDAVRKITDQDVLIELSGPENDLEPELRVKIIRFIKDQAVLLKIVYSDESDRIKMAAMSRLKSQEDILSIFGDPKMPISLRKAAIRNLARVDYSVYENEETKKFIDTHHAGRGLEKTFVFNPKKSDWDDIADDIISGTAVHNPGSGTIKWSYKGSQRIIGAEYNNWDLECKIGDFDKVTLTVTCRENGFTYTYSGEPVCQALYSVF